MAKRKTSRVTRNAQSRDNISKTNSRRRVNRYSGDSKEEAKQMKDTNSSSNDPSWYASDPTLLRDAASYPFSYNTGATEVHDPAVWNSNTNVEARAEEQIPGICSLRVYPTVGTAVNAVDPINVAAQSVYSFVRHANSGHSNYDAPDLMLYILAMANMYSFLVWCQRLYGYALTYDQRNRYIPADLIRTNNVDPDDLRNNLANFRFWVNTLIAKMVSFAVPATMSIFSRMSFMYSDYYIEGTSIKDQLYQFVPEGFYKFGIDSDSLGNLTWEAFNYGTLMTTADVMQYGDALFDAIWSQEDFGIMSGDILKAYGDKIIKLMPLPEYYNIVPKFDAMVLTQMKNADLVRLIPNRIYQSASVGTIAQFIYPQAFATTDTWYGGTTAIGSNNTKIQTCMLSALNDYRILTVDTDQPTPDVVIEATRLKVGYDAYKGWYKAGTELITKVIITKEPGVDVEIPPYICTLSNTGTDYDKSLKWVFPVLDVVSNFHYLPRFWVFNFNVTTEKLQISQRFDIDNFTLLTYEDVRKLHEAATVNMFAVPSIGKVV